MKKISLFHGAIFLLSGGIILGSAFPSYRLTFIGVPLYVPEIILLFSIVMSLFFLKPSIAYHSSYTFLFGCLLILSGLLLGLYAHGTAHGFGILKTWFLFPIGCIFFFVPRLREKSAANSLLAGWLCALSLVSIQALLSWFSGDLTYDGRLRAFFSSPNQLALFLAPAPILLGYFISISQKQWLPSLLILGALYGFVLWFTFSYTVWISLLTSAYIWTFSQTKKYRVLLVFGILALLFLLLWSQSQNPKITHWFSTPDRSSLSSRLMIWQSALLMIQHHPFVGIGAGNFQETYLSYQKFFPPYLEWAVPEPHNIFLAFWLESGILGLIGFLTLFWFIFRALSPLIYRGSKTAFFLGLYFINFLIQGFFDTPFWSLPLAISFWFAIFLVQLDPVKDMTAAVNEKK